MKKTVQNMIIHECDCCETKCSMFRRFYNRYIPGSPCAYFTSSEFQDHKPTFDDLTVDNTYVMKPEDWKPMIEAMAHLKNIPCCGDVAKRLELIFRAAQKGKYYCIELGYENQDRECFVVGMDYEGYHTIGDRDER